MGQRAMKWRIKAGKPLACQRELAAVGRGGWVSGNAYRIPDRIPKTPSIYKGLNRKVSGIRLKTPCNLKIIFYFFSCAIHAPARTHARKGALVINPQRVLKMKTMLRIDTWIRLPAGITQRDGEGGMSFPRIAHIEDRRHNNAHFSSLINFVRRR